MKHNCLNCFKRITYRFCLCSDCEAIHGRSAFDWPDWLRAGWIEEQRQRRSNTKFYQKIVSYDYQFSEDYLDYVPDGHPYLLSNRNPDQIHNWLAIQEEIEALPTLDRLILKMWVAGYTQRDIAHALELSRTTVWYHTKDMQERLWHNLKL